MQKRSIRDRLFRLVLACTLIASLALAASAISLDFGDAITTVTKNSSTTSSYNVDNGLLTYHVQGGADSVPYSATSSQSSHTFSTSNFPSTYRSYLTTTYKQAGFATQVSIAQSGSITIPSTVATGTYHSVLKYTYGSLTWSVKVNGSVIDSGYVATAPIKLIVVYERI